MTKRVLWFGMLAWAFALPGSGCSSTKSCVDLCAAREGCDGVFPAADSCEVQCKDREVFVKTTDCEVEQQSYDECLSPLESVCSADTDCASEAKLLFNCFQAYCNAHPTLGGCAPYSGTP